MPQQHYATTAHAPYNVPQQHRTPCHNSAMLCAITAPCHNSTAHAPYACPEPVGDVTAAATVRTRCRSQSSSTSAPYALQRLLLLLLTKLACMAVSKPVLHVVVHVEASCVGDAVQNGRLCKPKRMWWNPVGLQKLQAVFSVDAACASPCQSRLCWRRCTDQAPVFTKKREHTT